jgi:hypothetical protein
MVLPLTQLWLTVESDLAGREALCPESEGQHESDYDGANTESPRRSAESLHGMTRWGEGKRRDEVCLLWNFSRL